MYTNNSCINADGRGFWPKHTVKSSKCWQPVSPEPDFHGESHCTWRCPLSTESGEEEEGAGVAAPKPNPWCNVINILTLCDCVIQAMGRALSHVSMETLLQNCLSKSLHTCRPKGHHGRAGIFLILQGDSRSDGAWQTTLSPAFCFLYGGSWAGRLGEHCGLVLLFPLHWIDFCFFSGRQHLLAKSTGIPCFSFLGAQAPACNLLCLAGGCSKSREGTEAESQSRAWQGSRATGRDWEGGWLGKPLPWQKYLPNRKN